MRTTAGQESAATEAANRTPVAPEATTRPMAGGEPAPELLTGRVATDLRGRWDAVQTGFVDEPKQAVESADELVAEVMKQVTDTFAAERADLESQWVHGDNVSTEDLRIALRRYRTFFDRLLSI